MKDVVEHSLTSDANKQIFQSPSLLICTAMKTLSREDAEEFLSSSLNNGFLIFDVTLDSVNLLATVYLYMEMRKTKLMHKNLRIMMLSLTLALSLFSFAMLWKNVWYLLLNNYDFCKSITMIYNVQCFVCRLLHDVLQNVFGVTLIGIAFERIIASLFLKNYGEFESALVPITVITIEWLAGIAVAVTFMIIDISNSRFTEGVLYLSCASIFTHPKETMNLFFTGSAGFGILCIALIFLYQYNKAEYQKIGKRTLSARYQLAENIINLRLLVPSFIIYGFFYTVSIIFLARVTNRVIAEGASEAVIKESWIYQQLQNLMCTLYTTIYCFLCFTLHTPMQQSLKEKLTWFRRSKEASDGRNVKIVGIRGQRLNFDSEGDLYFTKLNEMTKSSRSLKKFVPGDSLQIVTQKL
uniref:G_PROTEIN_RECEP_F1_2 domain-containing protein n=1 Tax=Syphacia muris TaxID=451379 RepID=A0A0N5AFS2_9BILA